MACKYYRKGYFGVCCAFEPYRVASIAEMEQYCFQDNFVECPRFEVSCREEKHHAGAFSQQNGNVHTGLVNHECERREMPSFRNQLTIRR